jgi:ribosome-binding protein aMBF1 (putative translation factor)
MPNALRGQVDVPVGPHVFTLNPSFTVLATLEDALGRSIFAIVRDFSAPRTTKISELAKVISVASMVKVSTLEVGELVQAYGLNSTLEPLLKFLTLAITTDEELEKAEAKRKEDEAAKKLPEVREEAPLAQ